MFNVGGLKFKMIDFLKYRWFYVLISLIVIGMGIFSIIRWGYRYSIDFVGGTNLEYQLKNKKDIDVVKNNLKKNNVEVIEMNQADAVISIRAKALSSAQSESLENDLRGALGPYRTVLRSETVGPTLGKETLTKTLIASVLAIIGILVYMSFAFKSLNFALAAILAMMHDFLVVVGMYSLFSHFFKAQVDTLFVTALLTTMSFSVHDTIIIFDKIREYKAAGMDDDVNHYANKALTETLVRSLNNSMTIVFMLLALTLLGGVTIRFFALTLLVGTITGTYSSPFIATPILVWLEKKKSR